MDFQLVVQFAVSSEDDFKYLVEFEERLIAGNTVDVDGHDFGKDEMNIFIITRHPEASFQRVQEVAQEMMSSRYMKVAYRSLDGEEHLPLWPEGLKEFRVS